jgi:hypothetical protein
MKLLQKLIALWHRFTHAVVPAAKEVAPRRGPLFRHRPADIQRCDDGIERPPPLHWIPCHPTTIQRFKATMACQNGHVLTLQAHTVARDGTVLPSVVCPAKGCSFHARVRLVDWTFGPVG